MPEFARTMRILGREIHSSHGAVAIGVAVALGLAAGFAMIPRTPGPDDADAKPPEVTLLGKPLVLDDGSADRALDWVRRHAAGTLTLVLGEGESRAVRFGELGAQIDKVRLAQLVRDARDPTSPLRRAYRSAGGEGPIALPVPLELDRERALPELVALKDQVDRVPADARLDLEKKQLVNEQHGRLLDVDRTLASIEAALSRGEREARVEFEELRPKRTAADLGNVEFDEVLGFFETLYNRAERYEARTYNLRLAASKLDGRVLLPGDEFDFNEVVGPRDERAGYKIARVIAEGELVDGIGGGTCQISGTLHGAAFFGGLAVVERYPHTRPSGYIKMGLDATVVYPTINFRFTNPHPHAVVLHQTVKNGKVRAEVLGPKLAKTVTLIRRIHEAVPFEEVERPDAALPEGVRVLAQRGIPGFKLRRYRITREGPHAVRERWDDAYPPTQQIVRLGTGTMARDSVRVEDDPTPEYVADELLITTQGAGIAAESGMIETREPGRFGERGWMQKAGMPVWERWHANMEPAKELEPRKE